MIDPFGRHVSYLRVSVTDRCNYRCVYCMSENMDFLPKNDLLTLEELHRVCSAFIKRGVNKIRLTGGEPLVRRNVMSLFESLGQYLKSGELKELTLTTNGSLLAKYAEKLFQYGVRRVNVSLDSLIETKFQSVTRWGSLSEVLKGLDEAKRVGLEIKINAVALKHVNENELNKLVAWCGDKDFDLTFIETMPMGDVGQERVDQYLPLTEVRKRLEEQWTLDNSEYTSSGPATYVTVRETGKRVGFITPLTHNFCESCNRVRLTCTGKLYMCLGQDDCADLKTPLRQNNSEASIMNAIDNAILRKPKGHDFIIDRSSQPAVHRHMSVTGG
ncbi:MAG: GTP 3',8-cyclase MoaA [Pseudomonadota bacterium]|nr:GTP 3',8-cyclase MoaA [Pseudomonadota bacterium]